MKYYLAHDIEREEIRQAGYQRAVREHTWQKRFEQVFRQIGLAP
ncbi:MAG: glycosyltransferase [Candidatus Omnitrophica bacterium]|nr:glycosyltransferase [Candidatus Omnitrophota bacterium]